MVTAERVQVLSGVDEMQTYLKAINVTVGSSWLYARCQDGTIPAIKIAARWHITPDKLRAALGL